MDKREKMKREFQSDLKMFVILCVFGVVLYVLTGFALIVCGV